MRIMVTGGAGFIGSHTCDLLLEQGNSVCVIDNLSHGKRENLPDGVVFYECDILDAAEVGRIFESEQPEVMVHLAAQTDVTFSVENPVEDARINILGTLTLLEAGRRNGLKRVVYASSAAALGNPEYLPIDENHPLNMISGYGVTKHTVEHYLKIYNHLYDIGYAALRYANVYGPRQDSTGEGGVIAIFSDLCAKGKAPVIYGDGEQSRDFVYVKDVARANSIAAGSDKNGIFNVCTNSELTVNELTKLIQSHFDGAICAEYRPAREGDIRASRMSYDKIKNELGWMPESSFADGLAETIMHYRKG